MFGGPIYKMRYLKLFEDVGNIYYIDIDSDEYYNPTVIPISDDINQIKNFLSTRRDLYIDKHSNDDCIYIKKNHKSLKDSGNLYAEIFKSYDEWFFIKIYGGPKFKPYTREYYKCDQLEGLIKCLEDILV